MCTYKFSQAWLLGQREWWTVLPLLEGLATLATGREAAMERSGYAARLPPYKRMAHLLGL